MTSSVNTSLTMALIDVGLFWAYWHVAEKKAEPAGTARDRFVGQCRTISARHVRTVVLDDSPVLFRRSIPGGETYKNTSSRDKPPAALAELEAAKDLLVAGGLPVVGMEGLEADDLIAAWASEASRAGWFVRIYSDDKDLLQCIRDGEVTVFKRDRGAEKAGFKDWASADVIAKYGVPPARMHELLALRGDDGDNIPGVKGFGEEGAKLAIASYQNVRDAFADLGPDGLPGQALPERYRRALSGQLAAYDLSYALVRLDPAASASVQKSLLAPPVCAPPSADGSTSSADPEDRVESHVQGANGTQVKVLTDVKTEERGRSVLDEIADSKAQKARLDGWIGQSFEDSLEPRTPRDAWWLAGILDGAMAPDKKGDMVRTYAKIGNQNAIYAVILKGRELKLPAMLSLAHIKPVEGKLEVDAMLMIAIALRSGRVKYVRCIETGPERATWEALHADPGSVPQKNTFALDDAKRAGLYPNTSEFSPWRKYTRVMLRWRAVAELLRFVCPEAVAGLYVRGELQEIDEDEVLAGIATERMVA